MYRYVAARISQPVQVLYSYLLLRSSPVVIDFHDGLWQLDAGLNEVTLSKLAPKIWWKKMRPVVPQLKWPFVA